MGKTRGSVPMIRQKPSAMKTDIYLLMETLGYSQQQQIRQGYVYLGDGGFKKVIQ